jgi:hypothetical protein
MTDLLSKTLEEAMTNWGDKTHARVKGEKATLCGLKPYVGTNIYRNVFRTWIDVRPQFVTCKKCRKEMGL